MESLDTSPSPSRTPTPNTRDSVPTLQGMSMDVITKRLGELGSSIACRFCCGNTLSSPDQVKIVHENNNGGYSSITFPGAEDMAVQQLLGVCSVASFGAGCKEVTDLSYHNAFYLLPNRFFTSFQLCDMQILGEIQELMMPDMRGSIRAELYKLNIYSGPGGHFKAHVDTPRSSQMFGSLVVCLPTQFSGGALVTRHQGKEVRFDWSSSPQNPMQRVSWAAFFSDVEHEVLPVTDGYRLTLTYNLYCVDKLEDMPPAANITNSPFYHELRAAVNNPDFLQDGGVLGFSCQHQYVFQDLNHIEDIPCLLKGADNIVYMAGLELGLPVTVAPATTQEKYSRRLFNPPFFSHWSQPATARDRTRYLLPKFSKFCTKIKDGDDVDDKTVFEDMFGKVERDKEVTWCQAVTNFQPAAAYLGSHVHPCLLTPWQIGPRIAERVTWGAIYQAAVILVSIPMWKGGKRQSLKELSTSKEALEPSKKRPRVEDVYCLD